MTKQAHVYVIGDVIGVGFRAWVKIQAKILGVKGWVRNTHDRSEIFGPSGGVEAILQGDEEKVNQMIEILRAGSPIAHVTDLEIMWQEAKEAFDSFEIKTTV